MFAPDVVIRRAKAFCMLVRSAHKNWKKAKEDYKSHQTRQYHQFCAEKFDTFLELRKNEGNVDVRNILRFLIHKLCAFPGYSNHKQFFLEGFLLP